MLSKFKTKLPVLQKIRNVFFAMAIAALSLTSCKEDDNVNPGGGDPPAEKAALPERDQQYRYKTTGSDGSNSTSLLKVLSVKDSSGISVLNLEEEFTEEDVKFKLHNRAYSHGGVTTYEMSSAAGINSLIAYISEFAEIEDYELTGFPQKRMFENKTATGSKVTFSTQPVVMRLYLKIPVEGHDPVAARIDAKVKYDAGQLVKEETITTPAGNFKCSKWEYTYELYTKLSGDDIPAEESTVEYTVNVWTAAGVGVVKSTEVSGTDITTNELQKIEKP